MGLLPFNTNFRINLLISTNILHIEAESEGIEKIYPIQMVTKSEQRWLYLHQIK